MKKSVCMALLGLFVMTGSVFAAGNPQEIGEYGDWVAYYHRGKDGPVCYMASSPKTDEGNYASRGDIYFVVTHHVQKKQFNVVSMNAGYVFKSGTDVEVKIGAQTIKDFFTAGEKVWSLNSKVDKQMVTAMKRGSRMIVKGTSADGDITRDTYSLNGFTAAYKAISRKCGVTEND